MSTWAGVVRVSHMGARKADATDFHSERDQIAAMRDAVKTVGGELAVLPSELDVSGGLPLEQRPSLLAAVEGVESGKYKGIVVAYQSRLGRDTEHEEGVWRRVEAAGGQIIMALDGLDTATVDGKMVRRIRSAINTREREAHAERFENLREWATSAGIWQRRQLPRGYDKDPATRKLVPSDQADDVRAAFKAAGAGDTLSSIAEKLGMTTSGIRYLLSNRVYLGELNVGEHRNTAAHPPLVDIDTFEAAQVRKVRRPRGKAKAPALLAGLARCAGCGHVMSRSVTAAVIYTCHGRHSVGPCPNRAAVTAKLLDEHVEQIALHELARLDVTATESQAQIATARSALADAERELGAYLHAVSAADIGADAFRAGARGRQDIIDTARARLQQLLVMQPLAPEIGSGTEIWASLDAHGRNTLLRALLETVIVQRGGGRGSRTPISERVRVIAYGAGIATTKRGGAALGITPLPLPDLDDERVLRMPSTQDRL